MNKFLFRKASELLEIHDGDLRDVIVVLPARRSVLFLQKHLAEAAGKSLWLPQTFIFPQFVEWLSSHSIVSGADAFTDLYQCYREAVPNAAGFDVFGLWASTALKDFGDIDGSLADSKNVFSNLRSIREIEGWSFNSENLSKSQLQFILFWDDLGKLYEAYTDFQKRTNRWSYNALIKWMNKESDLFTQDLKGKSIYFIGMASFSIAETTLIKKLSEYTNTEVWWDIDEFYVNDEMHEAGFFARKFREEFKEINGLNNRLTQSDKKIHIYETTTSIGECYGASMILSKMSPDELQNTCVVVADEKLAEPFLASLSLPDVTVNLAIGLPLVTTTAARWFAAMLRIKQKLQTERRGIYHKDFMEWLQVSSCVLLPEKEIAEAKQNVISGLWIYIDEKKFEGEQSPLFNQLLAMLFEQEIGLFMQQSRICLTQATKSNELEEMQKVSNCSVATIIGRLEEVVQLNDFIKDVSSLNVLWNQILSSEKIQYEGEPVDGLQILGLRESRALDFDTIVLIGANEESLPGNAFQQSFIPFELRGYYKLPLPFEQESMIAYIFFRLLQAPKKVYLFYSSMSSDFKGTEQSRYITQLENELNAGSSKIILERHKLKLKDADALVSAQSVVANDFARRKLDKLFEYGISPSAINKFNTCPLDFYYRYILGLGEEEKLEEKMSSATFGSIVHHVLEIFYKNFKDNYPQEKDYEQLESTIDDQLNNAFGELYSSSNVSYGYNYLAKVVAKDMLLRIIAYEKKLLQEYKSDNIQPVLLDVEMILSRSVDVTKYDWDRPVKLRGKADRIERIAGITRILDYKTGKVESKDTNLSKSIAELMTNEKNIKLVQLLCYIYMYCDQGSAPENVTAGFYSFVAHHNGFMMLDQQMTEDKLLEFESAFMDWVKRVYATEKFEHNPDSKYCEYCS